MAKRRAFLLVGSILLLGCLVVAGSVNASAIDRQLHSWKLLPEPEHLTELYFTKPNNIPAGYTPGQAQTVSFTIHNLEYRPTTYRYTVEQISQDSSRKLPLASGTLTLQQNQYSNQKVNIVPGDLDRSQVSIQLSLVNENINYWVNKG